MNSLDDLEYPTILRHHHILCRLTLDLVFKLPSSLDFCDVSHAPLRLSAAFSSGEDSDSSSSISCFWSIHTSVRASQGTVQITQVYSRYSSNMWYVLFRSFMLYHLKRIKPKNGVSKAWKHLLAFEWHCPSLLVNSKLTMSKWLCSNESSLCLPDIHEQTQVPVPKLGVLNGFSQLIFSPFVTHESRHPEVVNEVRSPTKNAKPINQPTSQLPINSPNNHLGSFKIPWAIKSKSWTYDGHWLMNNNHAWLAMGKSTRLTTKNYSRGFLGFLM